MDKLFRMIYLLILLSLLFLCRKTTEKEINKSEIVRTSQTDTLKFTSGIRAIFQDSKGNWLGSHNEGVSFYDGKHLNISAELMVC
jgi:hypothetical protein